MVKTAASAFPDVAAQCQERIRICFLHPPSIMLFKLKHLSTDRCWSTIVKHLEHPFNTVLDWCLEPVYILIKSYIYIYIILYKYLVGGLEHLDYFSHHIGNLIIPTDSYFFRGVGQPPTTGDHPVEIIDGMDL